MRFPGGRGATRTIHPPSNPQATDPVYSAIDPAHLSPAGDIPAMLFWGPLWGFLYFKSYGTLLP